MKVICFGFFFFLDVDQFLKVFIACVTILLPFHVLVLFSCFWLLGMWDLSSLPGIELKTLALEGEVLTTRRPGKSPQWSQMESTYSHPAFPH